MSTSLHDVPSAAAVAAGFYPAVELTDAIGPTVDLVDADGPYFAIQIVGALGTGTTVSGLLQESANGTDWSAIAGASFTVVSVAANVQTIRFTPSVRYVRWFAEIAADEDPSAAIAAVIGRQKKTF